MESMDLTTKILLWQVLQRLRIAVGLPPVIAVVNECDPLRDEGIDFIENGVLE